MVQEQLPSATSLSSPMLKRAQITQTTTCASASSGGDSPTSSSSTLCTLMEHFFPPSPVREARFPGRPQLLSSAVFACNFTGEPVGVVTSLPWPPSSVCGAEGQQARLGLSAAVLTLPLKAGAGISECSVVVSPAPRAFPHGQGGVLVFGL